MADLSFLSGIAGGLGSAIGGLFQNKTNLKIARETNQAQMDLAKYQADRDLDLWNLNNAYNTPSAQMQRFEEAGLNPNLIYGNGQASSGNSSSPARGYESPTLHRPQVDNSYITSSAQLFMNGLVQASQVRKNDADSALAYQNAQNAQTNNELLQLKKTFQFYQNAKTKEEADIWRERLASEIHRMDMQGLQSFSQSMLNDSNRITNDALRPLMMEEKQASIAYTIQNTALSKANTSIAQQEASYRSRLCAARIANLISSTQLNDSRSNLTNLESEIKTILITSGLNLNNDEIDRLTYQFANDAEENSWAKFVKFASKIISK